MNADNRVFVGQRLDSAAQAWQMPQGGIDPGEDPEQAALRELWEETGVTADLVMVEAQTDGWVPYDLPHDLVPRLWNCFLSTSDAADAIHRVDLCGLPNHKKKNQRPTLSASHNTRVYS